MENSALNPLNADPEPQAEGNPVAEGPPADRPMTFRDKVREVAKTHKVCERTARRYLASGKLPPPGETRRLGSDGKWYPAHPRRPTFLSPLHKPLANARSNLRRVARADSFHDTDLNLLQEIAALACSLLVDWRAVTAGEDRPVSRPDPVQGAAEGAQDR